MQRTIFILLLLAWSGMAAYAQVPGYLGKKLSIQGEFHSFPALDGPTANNKGLQTFYGEEGGGFGLNWSAGARLGYVTSRLGQAVLLFDYIKTGMIQTAYSPASGPFGETGFDSHNLFYNITGFSAGIGFRKFNSSKGGLAPMGRYVGYTLSATFLKGDILDKQTSYAFGGPEHAALGTDPKHTVLVFGYDFGKNFVVKDRLLLSVGGKINIPLSPRIIGHALSEEGLWDPYSSTTDLNFGEGNTENFKTLAATRYGFHSVLMIYLGVGLLP